MKARLVKAASVDARHNQRQAERLDDAYVPPKHKRRKAKPFNPSVSHEALLRTLEAELSEIQVKALCQTCESDIIKGLEIKANACRDEITKLKKRMAGIASIEARKKSHKQSKLYARIGANPPRKAAAKVPKQGNHGFSRSEKPYKGPGKPTGPSIPGKPALIFAKAEAPPDRTKFNKPQHPTSYAFRSWSSGAVKRKR